MVELMELIEEGSFNQSCAYGYLIPGHSVYCHSEHPNAPRKCRRTWYTGGRDKDEDCPYFKPNKEGAKP